MVRPQRATMRFIVHGKDATTGRDVTLGVDEPRATEAVHAALGKRILVTRVTYALWQRVQAKLLPVCAVVLVLAIVAICLMLAENTRLRREALAGNTSHSQLLGELNSHASALVEARRKVAMLEAASSDQARTLVDELEAARKLAQARGADLQRVQQQLDETRAAASTSASALQSQLGELKKTLETREQNIKKLESQVKQGKATAKELEGAKLALAETRNAVAAAQVRAEKLEQANRDLLKQIEAYKQQLLAEAATSANDTAPAAPTRRWALAVDYDAAADFMNFRFRNRTAAPVAGEPKLVTVLAIDPDQGGQMTYVTDKERLYAGTIAVTLAADAPKELRQANMKTLSDFTKLFAPHIKEADAWLNEAVVTLQNKPATQRLQHIDERVTLTFYNNKLGLFTLTVEATQH